MSIIVHRLAAFGFGFVVRASEGAQRRAGHAECLGADLQARGLLVAHSLALTLDGALGLTGDLVDAELQVGVVAAADVDGVAAGAALILEDLVGLEEEEVAIRPRLGRLGAEDQRGGPDAGRDGRADEVEIPGPRPGSQVLTQKSALSTAPSAIEVWYWSSLIFDAMRAYSESGS